MLLADFFHGWQVLPQPEEGFGLVLFEGVPLQVQIPVLLVAARAQTVITEIFATVAVLINNLKAVTAVCLLSAFAGG